MALFGAAHRWGGAKRPPPKKSVTHTSYNDETWHTFAWPKEDPENI